MPGMFITDETLVRAVRWKLGILGDEDQQASQVWSGFLSAPQNQYLAEQLADFLQRPIRQAAGLRLDLPVPDEGWCDDPEFLRRLLDIALSVARLSKALDHVWRRGGDDGGQGVGIEMSNKTHLKGDEILKAIRWKLGIPCDNDPQAPTNWHLFCQATESRRYRADVADVLGELLRDAVRMELGLKVERNTDEQHLLAELWKAYKNWFTSLRVPNPYSGKIADLIWSQLPSAGVKTAANNAKPTPPPAVNRGTVPDPQPHAKPPSLAKPPAPSDGKTTDVLTVLPADSVNNEPTQTTERPPTTAGWRFKPTPTDEPDAHDDSARTSPINLPGGLKLVGARVRGKKHKHEGTHCDDWFEVRACSPWVVVAVSDGAGSYRFSRVGAKVSTTAAVAHLVSKLQQRPLGLNASGTVEEWWNPQRGCLKADDRHYVFAALHEAMGVALDAVKKAAQERAGQEAYEKILKRPLKEDDLSGTLLLAVCSTVNIKGVDYTYMATCSVGDGMMAAITQDGSVQLLSTPDGGEHASETYFLTSKGRLEPRNLKEKSFEAFRQLRALMVMTDGVADDYFPAQSEMLRLYADLVLNRVLPPPPTDTLTPDIDEARAACETELDVIGPEPQKVKIRSAATLASKMNMDVKQLVAAPELLQAGALTEQPDAVTDPADRLRLWLDTYTVRGSFDDRTLVVLHREVTA